ncbi:MAG TPA: SIS domain-containing protein [Armatimonadetes bacterium]|nr:SIS domain-containing protein [Armatimonadota bacterium]
MDQVRDYLYRTAEAIRALPVEQIERIIDLLWQARQEGRQIFVFGNGGSAMTASHLACDLGKGTARPGHRRFKVLSLADNVALMTAYANDLAYEDIFVEQLINLFQPGDVVIGISGSGNSENVLQAVRYAREHGGVTIGFTGFQGGKLKDLAEECLIVPSNDMQNIEDAHLVLTHILMQVFHRRVEEETE